MSHEVVRTEQAPKAIGPYSQATVIGPGEGRKMVFTAGQIGLDPVTMEVVPGGIEEQAGQVITNLTAVLAAAGAEWKHVVKTTIYLADMDDFAAVNAVYGAAVSDPPPARSTVAVSSLPKNVLVEIDLVAVVD